MNTKENDPFYLNLGKLLCGRLEMNEGNDRRALDFFQQANPENPLTQYYLAAMYQKTGRLGEAMEMEMKIIENPYLGFDLALATNLLK